MDASDVKRAMEWETPNQADLFSCIAIVSKYAMQHGPTDSVALDAIIRLRDLTEQGAVTQPALQDAVYSLCREAGLFPYLPSASLTWQDKLTYEFFRGPPEMNYVFHREQWLAFQHLLSGKSLVLSAPTSFGKSVLIHAYIAQKKPHCVVIVVPTIALLDQFRRKLTDYFANDYAIITRNDQRVDQATKRIYVVTQERLLDRDDIAEIDLLAIDEYYKLDSGRERQGEGSRSALLNAALKRFLTSAKQIFFLGPSVAGIDMREDLRPKFVEISSEFSTVAIDIHDHTESLEGPYDAIASLLTEYGSDKSLIFSKSPPAARRLADYVQSHSPLATTEELEEFADWLSDNYHPDWPLVTALRAGYGLHHGSIPRSIAQTLVRSFNDGGLNALICTSTLIEGVNTAAKNVFIFDKKISNTNFDYFDFRNIAGRSGRMGHHFVGRIFLFHAPPNASPFQLEIPALGDDRALPDAVLLNLPDGSLTGQLLSKKKAILDRFNLPDELVRQFAPYGLGSLETISEHVNELLASGDRSLLWRGHVGYPELLAVFEIAWKYLRFNKGRLNPKEAAFHANRLRISRSLRDYFDGLTLGKEEAERRDAVEKGFRALVAFDYAIPKVLIDMETLINHHCRELGVAEADYSYMAQGLDNYFTHHWIKALDEYGVPIPLGRRFISLIENADTLEEAIALVKASSSLTDGTLMLTPLERELVERALG